MYVYADSPPFSDKEWDRLCIFVKDEFQCNTSNKKGIVFRTWKANLIPDKFLKDWRRYDNDNNITWYKSTGYGSHILEECYSYFSQMKILCFYGLDTSILDINNTLKDYCGFIMMPNTSLQLIFSRRRTTRKRSYSKSFITEDSHLKYILKFYRFYRTIFGEDFRFYVSQKYMDFEQIYDTTIYLDDILSSRLSNETKGLITELCIPFSKIPFSINTSIVDLKNLILTSKFEDNNPFGTDLAFRTVIDRYYGDMFRDYFKTNVTEHDGEQLLKDLNELVHL